MDRTDRFVYRALRAGQENYRLDGLHCKDPDASPELLDAFTNKGISPWVYTTWSLKSAIYFATARRLPQRIGMIVQIDLDQIRKECICDVSSNHADLICDPSTNDIAMRHELVLIWDRVPPSAIRADCMFDGFEGDNLTWREFNNQEHVDGLELEQIECFLDDQIAYKATKAANKRKPMAAKSSRAHNAGLQPVIKKILKSKHPDRFGILRRWEEHFHRNWMLTHSSEEDKLRQIA